MDGSPPLPFPFQLPHTRTRTLGNQLDPRTFDHVGTRIFQEVRQEAEGDLQGVAGGGEAGLELGFLGQGAGPHLSCIGGSEVSRLLWDEDRHRSSSKVLRTSRRASRWM